MAERGRRRQGFTLIELMVVLVIIGLAAAAVVFAMPEPGGSLAGEAERFAARAKAARDTAILESRAVALQIGRGGYEVARRRAGAWQTEARFDWAERTAPELPAGGAASIRFDFDRFRRAGPGGAPARGRPSGDRHCRRRKRPCPPLEETASR